MTTDNTDSTRGPRPERLRGEFVDLRPLGPSDAGMTHTWRQSARAVYLNIGAQTVEAQEHWIRRRGDSEYNFIIELKDGQPVGMLSLIDVDLVHRRAESSRFLIGDEEAVRGVPAAVEAMKLLYEFAFDTLQLERVYGSVAEDNELMIKWQRFMGMAEEGRQRKHFFINGKFQDAVLLGILADEYRDKARAKMDVFIRAAR